MSTLLRKDARTVFPDLMDWLESPFLTLRPYLAQPIRLEDYAEDGRYVVRAELAGIDPARDVEVSVGAGYLTIRAERTDKTEGRHRSEFRYGTFTRTLPLPPDADEDNATATYRDGILTVAIPLKGEQKTAARKVQVKAAGSAAEATPATAAK
jgi:HSP20 family protein